MNFTTLAVLVLSLINISLAVINLINTSHSDTMLDQIDNITEKVVSQIRRMDVHDKAINELGFRMEGETDVITRIIEDHRKMKREVDKDHLLTMTMYNDYAQTKHAWKIARQAMEEAEEREDSDNQ